MKRAEKAA
jgi:hypothetical protein